MDRIIGLCGRARSGKDTVANLLTRKYGFEQDSFAAPIRRTLCHILGVNLSTLEKIKDLPHPVLGGKTPRYAMQTLGTEWGRDTIYENVWLESLYTRCYNEEVANLVVADVRFDNEAEFIIRNGGVMVEVFREGAHIAENQHASEAGIDKGLINFTLVNNGTIGELYTSVDMFMEWYGNSEEGSTNQ